MQTLLFISLFLYIFLSFSPSISLSLSLSPKNVGSDSEQKGLVRCIECLVSFSHRTDNPSFVFLAANVVAAAVVVLRSRDVEILVGGSLSLSNLAPASAVLLSSPILRLSCDIRSPRSFSAMQETGN